VPHYTRQQLKEDKFAEAAGEAVSWAGEHRGMLTAIGVIIVVALGLILGGWAYLQHRNELAMTEMSAALRILDTPISATPAPEGITTFASAKERATAARKKLQEIQDKYPHTRTAEFAKYLDATVAADEGDSKFAESQLKDIAQSRDKEFASLAKYALVSVYRRTNRDKEAADTLQELIKNPTASVPKVTAQLELASMYEQTQPKEAMNLYALIEKENPGTQAAEFAHQKITSAKPF
jgi:predicted negative regulator of RcsB-dependent stress response